MKGRVSILKSNMSQKLFAMATKKAPENKMWTFFEVVTEL